MHSTTIDNANIAMISQGETLGTRADAKVVKMASAMELELAA